MRRELMNSTALLGLWLAGIGSAGAAELLDPAPIASESGQLSLPAVSAQNQKFSIYGGFVDHDSHDGETIGVEGSFTAPINHSTGFQADGSVGEIDGDFVGTLGGHLFWRDPSRGLIGGYASVEINDVVDSDRFRVAAEVQAYRGRVTYEGLIGWEHQDYDVGPDDDELLALANIAYYPDDNTRVFAGYQRFGGVDMAAAGIEHQLASSHLGNGTSVYLQGRVGSEDFAAVTGGIRFFFSKERKSLIRRHREDDPNFYASNYLTIACQPGHEWDNIEGRCIQTFAISDLRLKRDVTYLTTLDSGIKIYSFRYIWSETVHVGAMAQDLLAHETYRHAVVSTPSGFYAVNYAMLGLKMTTLKVWQEQGQSAVHLRPAIAKVSTLSAALAH